MQASLLKSDQTTKKTNYVRACWIMALQPFFEILYRYTYYVYICSQAEYSADDCGCYHSDYRTVSPY
jgi:hypothetical protein